MNTEIKTRPSGDYVHGLFLQEPARRLRLSSDMLLVVKWIVDHIENDDLDYRGDGYGGRFFIVDYSNILHDLPILTINRRTLQKKWVAELVTKNVLARMPIHEGIGTCTGIALGCVCRELLPADKMTNRIQEAITSQIKPSQYPNMTHTDKTGVTHE